ncbi:CheY-like chemotaxis protein [Rhodopirellula rubra]|uniref:CheY-like chemotaxis protein n=1 Tax=Aporhodopirellula rubra TaxID=980271 RepID=A0A7W5DTY8_9BACT|nr:response regulator [Aporhodopirellula rubra]MBB3204509.1 CheY-like chemotaxis protein [Aporhodopirellula rubra]
MFIDDDPVDQTLYQRMCDRSDEVESAVYYSYADEALEQLTAHPESRPDLIFLDMRIPRMSGLEFLQQIDALGADTTTKMNVIIATTSIHPDDKEAATAFSFVRDFVTKPISNDQLQQIIDDLRSV